MKKMVLALTLAIIGLAALDANAYGWRRYHGYRNGCCPRNVCEPCAPVCEPCPKPCATYKKVIHEAPCQQPPCCERAMIVREPAICHEFRKCEWRCPDSCTMNPHQSVDGEFTFQEVVQE